MKTIYTSLLLLITCSTSLRAEPIAIPRDTHRLLTKYCIDCHDADSKEGDLNLDLRAVDWDESETRKRWTEVYTRVSRSKMPPKEMDQPTDRERRELLAWLDRQLIENSPLGGTPMRRLNRREFANTVKQVFSLRNPLLSPGFPVDNELHGFDTVGEALVISPAHLEAYSESATLIADYLFPPPQKLPPARTATYEPEDLAISFSSGMVVDGAMRLASSGQIAAQNSVRIAKFEAPASGLYQLSVDASTRNPPKGALPLLVAKASQTGKQGSRVLASFSIRPGRAQTYKTEVTLYRGERVLFFYTNGPLDYGDRENFPKFLYQAFAADRRLAAAWKQVSKASRGVPRGGAGWDRLKKAMASPNLKLNTVRTPAALRDLVKTATSRNGVRKATGETIVYKYLENGPNIGIHSVTIQGPTEAVKDPGAIAQAKAKEQFLGTSFDGNEASVREFLKNYLTSLYRRPSTPSEVDDWYALVDRVVKTDGGSLEDGLHLLIRTSLLSPKFLYKEHGTSAKLTRYELAARLSYFLTSKPPTGAMLANAQTGALENPDRYRKAAELLIKTGNRTFAQDFTGQWLDTNLLDTLMPATSLIRSYTDAHRKAIKEEAVRTFSEILTNNDPITDFIAPDYVYTDAAIGWQIYQLPRFKPKSGTTSRRLKPITNRNGTITVTKVSVPANGRHGGLLSMPAVMMATANGVDTHPVTRGVWVLENILGMPPPEPPDSVPALSPDLSNARTLRQRLSAHRADASCASCHEDIDPVGFVLENFDAVGKWRTSYPATKKKAKSPPVNATGMLPDGTKLNDITDLKRWLVAHPHHFANCLAEKLMVYGTGRALNYREKKLVEAIVAKNLRSRGGFQDLVLDLVASDVFSAR